MRDDYEDFDDYVHKASNNPWEKLQAALVVFLITYMCLRGMGALPYVLNGL